ncbi:MAG: efflux RND transporter periplasmic adaptor subunit [Balneolaceae bacterium]|nr:efflux RND transporter periplasmic adaptor subunit [Balneolaceae bacterium]
MQNISSYIIWLALFGFILGACNSETEEGSPISEEDKESAEVRPEVIFAVADDQPIYYYVESQGVVEANREVSLKPKISGFVETSNMTEGARFQKGDTLLSFIEEEWELALQEAQNEYQKALNQYRIESRLRRQNEDTTGTNGSTDKSDDMVRITTGLAQAELALDRAKLNLSYATVLAPYSGRLAIDRRIEPGSYVNAGTELGTLISDRTVRVRFDVLESEISRIDAGMNVRLTARTVLG